MATSIEYALLAGASYYDTREIVNRFPVPTGWTKITNPDSHFSDQATGFEAISFQKGTEIVISYAGTYGNGGSIFTNPDKQADAALGAGLWSDQLGQAAAYYLEIKALNQGATISFTGHSLGGGLASLMAVFFGETAYTFDQAPFKAALIQAQNLKNYLLNDRLNGNEGNDVILGGADIDKLWGGDDNDYLDGGTEADELVGGTGDDILIGGKGNDSLWGGEGRDTYIYKVGDGVDNIYDTSDKTTSNTNILRFDVGVNKDNIKLHLGSLLLDLGNGDAVHIGGFDQNDVFNSSSIDSFEFADGSVLTTTELLARGFDLDGTDLDEAIAGTNTTDRINCYGGNDTLIGLGGNDSLYGGAANDDNYDLERNAA